MSSRIVDESPGSPVLTKENVVLGKQPARGQPAMPLGERSVNLADNPDDSIASVIKRTNRVSLNDDEVVEPAAPHASGIFSANAQQSEPESGPKSRLTIHHLVLTNFKSYAGRQQIGPFHSSFSAVVGPNGSGKSNVIDSLLFVFGFRASKMRQSKVSALIHNSAAYPDLDWCSVEVHFCDVVDNATGESASVEGSELVVSRKSYRNNSSKYYINGREMPFSEVSKLLKDRGIDLDHKRFLILQGEVESIAQMKAKAEGDSDDGLLEYLEDIIGTSQYKPVIEESLGKIEVLNEDCVEKSNRLKLVEKELDDLEDKRKDILDYLRTENAITLKRSALLQHYAHLSNKKIELSNKVLQEQEERLQHELAENKHNVDAAAELKEQYATRHKQLDQLKKKLQECSKTLSKHEIEKVRLEERQKHLDTKRKKLEKTIDSSTHALNEAQSSLANYEEEAATLNAEHEQLKATLQSEVGVLEQIQNELKDKTAVFTDRIEQLQRELEPWRSKITAKQSELAVAESEVQLLTEKQQSAEEAVRNAEQSVETTMKQGRAKERELERLKGELEHVESQISLGAGECEHASLKLAKMKQQLLAGRQQVSTAKESLTSAESQSKVLRGLSRLSQSGRVEGFCGRLGDLGAADAKYDEAMSTMFDRLDDIVVNTTETGKQCVDYLRNNNLGRARFILLDQLPQRNLKPIQTPENVPRLFDLIKPSDPRYAPAFYSVVQDTLVAKDIEQARRIAYGKRRYRVVTLDGSIIDLSGALSGGGEKMKGRLGTSSGSGSSFTEEQVREMDAKQAEQEESFRRAEDMLMQMETTLKSLQEQKPVLELDISKAQVDIATVTKSLAEAKAQLVEAKAAYQQIGADTKALRAAESRVAKLTSELEQLRAECAGLEQQIEDLQEQIMSAGGVRLRMQSSKVDGIKDQIHLTTERLANGVKEKAKATSEVRKHTRAIETAEREIKESLGEYESSKEELDKRAREVAGLEQQVSAFSDEVEENEEAVAACKAQLDAKQQEIDSLRSTEIEIKNTVEQHRKVVKDEQRAVDSHKGHLRELKLHDFEDLQQDGGLFEYSADELEGMDKSELKSEIEALEGSIRDARVDMKVLEEYRKRKSDYDERRDVLNESVASRDAVKKLCDDLRNRRLEEFMAGFNTISLKLKEMYQMITMGGNAELELVDSLDPFSEGILFSVMPPKKSWRNISNLSGGEKTLSSLALVFALHHYKPTPLYVMDEIDAALDFRNVSIVATYIKERTKNGQFIVISLRNNMFELAKQLVGIYKVNNMTKSISLLNKDYVHGTDEPEPVGSVVDTS